MSARAWLIAALVCLGCLLPACRSTKPTPAPVYSEVPRVRSIAVQRFEGDVQGEMTRSFVQALAASGLKVVERQQGPDAILSGSVDVQKSGRRRMVFLGNTKVLSNGQLVSLSNPVVTVAGSQVVPQAQGMNPYIVAESAALGLSARLAEASTGNLLWAHEFSYESLDPLTARQAIVATVSRALLRSVPQFPRRQVSNG